MLSVIEAIRTTKTHRKDGFSKVDLMRLSVKTRLSPQLVYAKICELHEEHKVYLRIGKKANFIKVKE